MNVFILTIICIHCIGFGSSLILHGQERKKVSGLMHVTSTFIYVSLLYLGNFFEEIGLPQIILMFFLGSGLFYSINNDGSSKHRADYSFLSFAIIMYLFYYSGSISFTW